MPWSSLSLDKMQSPSATTTENGRQTLTLTATCTQTDGRWVNRFSYGRLFGLPYIAVYSDYYILAGSRLRKSIWLMTKKPSHDNLTHDGFHFGEIIANPAKLNTLDAKRALQIDCDTYDWSNFAKKPSLRGAINRLIMTYYNSALPVSNGTPG